MQERVIEKLRAGIQGSVLTPEQDIRRYRTDFGRVVTRDPAIVVRATCEQDILHTLAIANESIIKVAIRGAAHSCYGQTLCPGGIVIDNLCQQAEWAMVEDDCVEVRASSRWRDVQTGLNQSGRAVPVLTDYLDFTVGGTLSVGGYGIRSLTDGSQVDQIRRLKLITWDGRSHWCSPAQNQDLFRYALAGLGQLGIIERVVMRTIPYSPSTFISIYPHPSLQHLVESVVSLMELSAPPDQFDAFRLGGQLLSKYGINSGEDEFDAAQLPPNLRRMPAVKRYRAPDYPFVMHQHQELFLEQFPRCRRLWTDYMMDADALQKFIDFIDVGLTNESWGRYLGSLYFLANRKAEDKIHFPFEPASGIPSQMTFLVGMFFMVPEGDDAGTELVQDALLRALDLVVKLGGRPYLYGWNPLDAHKKKMLYGEATEHLHRLRQVHDPQGVCNLQMF
jgi:hypothetical protein